MEQEYHKLLYQKKRSKKSVAAFSIFTLFPSADSSEFYRIQAASIVNAFSPIVEALIYRHPWLDNRINFHGKKLAQKRERGKIKSEKREKVEFIPGSARCTFFSSLSCARSSFLLEMSLELLLFFQLICLNFFVPHF